MKESESQLTQELIELAEALLIEVRTAIYRKNENRWPVAGETTRAVNRVRRSDLQAQLWAGWQGLHFPGDDLYDIINRPALPLRPQ